MVKMNKMGKKMIGLTLVVVLVAFGLIPLLKAKAATATVPLSVTVNGALVVSDADNDGASGKDPTKNVSISLTPDLGQSVQSGTANFRIRTNKSDWRLTAQRSASSNGNTGIADADVKVLISKTAGTKANVNAGSIASAFAAQTDLTAISTASAVDVITGTAKTSSSVDNGNSDNYFQVNSTYSINPDFFYSPGTFSSTITYSLVSP